MSFPYASSQTAQSGNSVYQLTCFRISWFMPSEMRLCVTEQSTFGCFRRATPETAASRNRRRGEDGWDTPEGLRAMVSLIVHTASDSLLCRALAPIDDVLAFLLAVTIKDVRLYSSSSDEQFLRNCPCGLEVVIPSAPPPSPLLTGTTLPIVTC